MWLYRALVTALISLLLQGGVSAETAVVVKMSADGDGSKANAAFAADLSAAGYTVSEINMADLCDPAKLNSNRIDLLVLPNSASMPFKSIEPIKNYLKNGGDILAFNTPLWQHVLINADGNWISTDDYAKSHAGDMPEHVIADFTPISIAEWKRSSDALDHKVTYETTTNGPAEDRHALHVKLPDLTGYDTFGPESVTDPFPGGNSLTVFSAKGDENTHQLAVEWSEKDDSRWIAVIPLTQEWKQYVLTPSDFVYWHSNPNRGFGGDEFHPENARRLSFGLAFSHTGNVGGPHEYWIGPVGTAAARGALAELVQTASVPILDTLSPGYKFFQTQDAAAVSIIGSGRSVDIAPHSVLSCPHPRPSGAGFDKGRSWRWIPLMQAESSTGEWRGNPATLTIHSEGDFAGGAWASFALDNADLYKDPAVASLITRTAARMRNGVFLLDGGTNFYTYFENQGMRLGARVVNLSRLKRSEISARVILKNARSGAVVTTRTWPLALQPGKTVSVSYNWRPTNWPAAGFIAIVELLQDGKTIDHVEHEVHVWQPKKIKNFVTIKNGDFYLGGKRWRINGVNYMPSSGIGVDDGEYFEYWLGAKSYDPEVVERDIRHIADLGLNAVSIFIYESYAKDQNLLDILRRLDNYGLKANLSLRPGTPMDLQPNVITNIIKYYKLWENDTVFAYDLAWEPSFGTHDERKVWDRNWEKWIVERYGSVADAERDWSFSVPREDGVITNPTAEQIDTDGKWRAMTAAYRRFLDTLLYEKYGAARHLVRSLDPNHFVSFRMSEAANPTYRWEGRISYDFPGLAGGVDFLAPEAYGRIGDWEKVKPGWFQYEYARWAAPNKPMIWPEMGTSVWDTGRMQDDHARLDFQRRFHEDFYRMLISSSADGVFFWWYAGGFRTGENSDYGIINPDGTDRPVTQVIRKMGPRYLSAPDMQPNTWLTIDRDAHPDGVAGIYDEVNSNFWEAIRNGRVPALRTEGTGTTSADCPLIAVGNTPCTGNNPPKYLEAVFDNVEILGANGKWVRVEKDGSVRVKKGKPISARVFFTNLGEATLLNMQGAGKQGFVAVTAECNDRIALTPIKYNVPHLGSSTLSGVKLTSTSIVEPVRVTLSFKAIGRTAFGEKFSFVLRP